MFTLFSYSLSGSKRSRRAKNRLFNFYVRIMPRAVDAKRCSIFIYDHFAKNVWLKSGTGLKERSIEVSEEDSIVGQVINSGKTIIQSNLDKFEGAHKKTDVVTGFVTHSVICVPIKSMDGTRVTGAIQLLNKDNGEFNKKDEKLLIEMAHFLREEVQKLFFKQEIHSIASRAYRQLCCILQYRLIN